MKVNGKPFRTVWWENNRLHMINQPLLPHRFETVSFDTHVQTAKAIQTMVVRGAGAIGATGGFAMAQAVLSAPDDTFHTSIANAADVVANTRPTAQNLFYAIQRVLQAVEAEGDNQKMARQADRKLHDGKL